MRFRLKTLGGAATTALALVLVWSSPIDGQPPVNRSTLEPHIVRVVVRAAQATAASGFLWQTPDQVVTSLHAVPEGTITVSCLGENIPATVSKVLVRADLALLTASKSFSRCRPLTQVFDQKPEPGSSLFTLGSFQNATITSRSMTKEYASLETLNGLVTGATLAALKRFNSPATDLEIYYVQSGALPGYSGGPVFDSAGRLVGIVDGGLNKGQDGYNWVIPARHLSDLMSSTEKMPSFLTQSSAELFSARIVDDEPVIGGGRGGASARPVQYLRTKTQTLDQLARTSDDPGAFASLLKVFEANGAQTKFEMSRRFDIYEHQEWDFIFATPARATITWEAARQRYVIRNPDGGFETLSFDANAGAQAADGTGWVIAGDPRYFQEYIAFALGDCEHPAVSPAKGKGCQLDQPTVRMIDFGNGNKILKFGIFDWTRDSKAANYKYRVVAVRGERAYYGIFNSNGIEDLGGVFALNLITFSNLLVPGRSKPYLETELDYDDSADDPDTVGMRYYEGKEWKFYNARGKIWSIPTATSRIDIVEQRRDRNFVYLKGPSSWYAVPIDGGSYSVSSDQGKTWTKAGSVVRQ